MSEETKIETTKEKPVFHSKSAAGKGDSPRNISKKFRDNYDKINWTEKKLKITMKVDKNTTIEL
jgi:hypothetical protein